MKQIQFFLMLFFVSMGSYGNMSTNCTPLNLDPPDEFTSLVEFLEGRVDFIKGDFPIIMADEVKKNLKNESYHVIDIRTDSWFEYGHIKNAANVSAEELLNYFKTEIDPSGFEKIVLKQGLMIMHFVSNPDSAYYATPTFQAVLAFVQGQGRKLPVGRNSLGRLTDRFIGIHPTDNDTPCFGAPVAIVVDINRKGRI